MDRLQLDIRKVSKTKLGGMEFRKSRHFAGKMAVLMQPHGKADASVGRATEMSISLISVPMMSSRQQPPTKKTFPSNSVPAISSRRRFLISMYNDLSTEFCLHDSVVEILAAVLKKVQHKRKSLYTHVIRVRDI